MSSQLYIHIAGTTHTGLERDNNEDAYAFCPDLTQPQWINDTSLRQQPLSPHGALIIVADGIGSYNAGEVASSLALKSVAETFTTSAAALPATAEAATKLLKQAISRAHEAINQHIIEDFHTMGMGTTIVLAWVLPQHTHIAWCGDSRCYAYTPSKGLTPLTHDHSYVQQLIDQGTITPEEAFTHPDSNLITRAIGDVDCPSEAETLTIPTEPDTTLILCTDGLCGYNTDSTIAEAIRQPHRPDRCCQSLLQLALSAGGHDNIAIAVAHLTTSPPPGPLRSLWAKLTGKW